MERHDYKMAVITCPHCKGDDLRELRNKKYWCPDCNSYWDIKVIATPIELAPNKWGWRERDE